MHEEILKYTVPKDLDTQCVNTIRFLSVDAVQKAESGHPGLPMGAAPMAYVLWTRFLKHNPINPHWFDRDRFIPSAGHGSMLLYSLLYLTGYDLSLEELKAFRQWGSRTPGHPERGVTPGVEVTTGPLGQGFGNDVGMAIAEAHMAALYNRPGFEVINHYTYGIVSDGDLMEGISSEAASLAGHLKLGKLIYLYDNNHISLASSTNLTFTEDRAARFESYGWHIQSVEDGNDLDALDRALKSARQNLDQPSLILVNTHIGFGSPNKQDTYQAHGSPLGEEEVRLTKQNLGWPDEPSFYVPEQALNHFRKALDDGKKAEVEWEARFQDYSERYPELAKEFETAIQFKLPENWDSQIPEFFHQYGPVATRVASEKILNAIAPRIPMLIGGSADLAPSTHTVLAEMSDFESPSKKHGDLQGSFGPDWSYAGRNLHFGVREHGMGTILNGMAAHGGVLPFGATFLIFSDYMLPSMRLAALMGLHVIYVFTHDSIGLGEDGPTHQPVEQLLGLRSIPNFLLLRPADANESAGAWRIAIEHQDGPVALVLSRQKLPVLDIHKYPQLTLGVKAGGYILAHAPQGAQPDIILVATGSEVHLALEARLHLEKESVKARVVSLPCWRIFNAQPDEYKRSVLPPDVPILAIEAGTPLGWKAYIGPHIDVIGVDHFGASAPGKTVMRKYGFTPENVVKKTLEILQSGS